MNRLRHGLLPAILLTGLVLTGCSGSGSSDAGEPTAALAEGPGDAADQSGGDLGLDTESAAEADRTVLSTAGRPDTTMQQAIIQIGTMTVQSDDVAAARFDLEKVVDAYNGSIADEKTTATSEGEVRLSRVVLRIPSADFDEVMIELGKLGEVTASTRKAQDVTGQIIDTQARIRAQEQSLQRVEVLFSQAQNIRDIVAIEAQLSRRQAELDSLKGQLAYLEDQASLSTITVYLEQSPEGPTPLAASKDDDTAFVSGLKDGWDALTTLGAGLATVAGALLPFAVVGLIVGIPGVVVARRWLARHPLRRPATTEA